MAFFLTALCHGRSGPVARIRSPDTDYTDDSGRVDQELLYRANEAALYIEEEGRAWSFDADGKLFRLASEARRLPWHLAEPARQSV